MSRTASFARRSVSEVARSRFWSMCSVPMSSLRNGADGPNGWTLSSRTTRPRGFRSNPTSTSAGYVPRASSRVRSTIRPPRSTSNTCTRCIPRTNVDRNRTMSSMERPTHCSGASRIWVSPWTGGTRGPTNTFGYPNRPTNTPGGEDPSRSIRSIIGAVFIMESQRTRIGQRVFPHRSFAPRHWMHKPLEIAARVSASNRDPKADGEGCFGRASTNGRRTRGGLKNLPTGGANPPLLLRFPEHGGALRVAPGSYAKGNRLCRGHPAEASLPVPRRHGAGRIPRGDEVPHRRGEAADAGVLPRPPRLGAGDGDQGAAFQDQGARRDRGRNEGHEHPRDRCRNVGPSDVLRHRTGGDERRQSRPGVSRGDRRASQASDGRTGETTRGLHAGRDDGLERRAGHRNRAIARGAASREPGNLAGRTRTN